MRTVTLIIVHCTANRAGSALRMADIDRYHRFLGWLGCGYHYVIPTDGAIEPGRPEEFVGRTAGTITGTPSVWRMWEGLPVTARLLATPVPLHKRRHSENCSVTCISVIRKR